MKVRELIEELKKLPQDIEVVYRDTTDNDSVYYQEVLFVELQDSKAVINKDI